MNRYRIFLLTSALALVLIPSCKRDEMSGGQKKSKSVVSFVIGGDMAVTKSLGQTSVMDPVNLSEDCGIAGLILSETVTSLDAEYFPDSLPETKGTPIYTENFDAIYGGFSARAFEPKNDGKEYSTVWGSDSYLENAGVVPFSKVDGEKNIYQYDYNTGYDEDKDEGKVSWPEESGSLHFFLESPYSVTKDLSPKFYAVDATHPMGSIQFDYTSPKGTEEKDGELQKDILFTSKVMSEETKDSDNKIIFYHALTAIKFKDGKVGDDIVTIKKVTFNNIVGAGHCTITPNYTDNSQKKSSECTVWTNIREANCSFTQAFNGTVNEYSNSTHSGDDGAVPESFNKDGSALNNLNDRTFSKTFMLIPQTCGDSASLTVYYTLNGKSTEYHRTVSLKGITWKPGELRTYTISINDVKVDVDDKMENQNKAKTSITTTNTGNVTAYLRAAMVANWVYTDASKGKSDIVEPCDIFTTGKFRKEKTGGFGFQDNWVMGEDGYLYYTKPVLPGYSTIYDIFDRYMAPEYSPYPQGHLEIAIALQGVQFDADKEKVTTAWGVDEVYVMDLTFDSEGNMTRTKSDKKIKDVLETNVEEF